MKTEDPNLFRVAIVGAATLKGKELKDVLEERNFPAHEIKLLDDDESLGQLERVQDEVAVVQPVGRDQLNDMDFTFFSGKEGKVHVVKLVAAYGLHHGHLILDAFKLAKRFIIVQQLDLMGRKIAFFQHVLELFAFERGCADNCDAKKVRVFSLHLGSGASL